MKKKITIILLVIFGSYYFYSYNSENKKYEILNEIIKDNDLYLPIVCTEPSKIEIPENNLNEFDFFSQLSVNFQKLTQFGFSFKPNRIKYFNKRQNKLVFSETKAECENEHEFIYKISEPIISPDKKTVLLKITEDCNCMLGGQSNTFIYKKIDGKWRYKKTIRGWIS